MFTTNQYLLSLLIGVGFLRLIATPKGDGGTLPKGKSAWIQTYLNVHLFSSVINLSALILVGDKLYKKSPLNNTQIILLTRAFASDAYWSPFFVAFAAALSYLPGLDTTVILINGIALAFVAFAITYYETVKSSVLDIDNFTGYPIVFNTLIIPVLLALFVVLTKYYYPAVNTIILISLFSISLVVIVLPFNEGLNRAFKKMKTHVYEELPKMKSELSLFMVAGMFGVLFSSFLVGMGVNISFAGFDWIYASVLLAIFILLGFVGIHPLISIAILGDFLTEANHTLFAVMFLIAWSITIAASVFSGLNLTISARYKIEAKEILKVNFLYVLKMYLIGIFSLYIVSKYLHIYAS
jgi:hypothetical protein